MRVRGPATRNRSNGKDWGISQMEIRWKCPTNAQKKAFGMAGLFAGLIRCESSRRAKFEWLFVLRCNFHQRQERRHNNRVTKLSAGTGSQLEQNHIAGSYVQINVPHGRRQEQDPTRFRYDQKFHDEF